MYVKQGLLDFLYKKRERKPMSKSKKSTNFERAMEALKKRLRSKCMSLGDFAWHKICIIEWLSRIDAFEPFLVKIHKKDALSELIDFLEEIEMRGFLTIIEKLYPVITTKIEQKKEGNDE